MYTIIITSAKIIQLNERECRDEIHMRKIVENRKSISNTIKDTIAQSCAWIIYGGVIRMIVL